MQVYGFHRLCYRALFLQTEVGKEIGTGYEANRNPLDLLIEGSLYMRLFSSWSARMFWVPSIVTSWAKGHPGRIWFLDSLIPRNTHLPRAIHATQPIPLQTFWMCVIMANHTPCNNSKYKRPAKMVKVHWIVYYFPLLGGWYVHCVLINVPTHFHRRVRRVKFRYKHW